MCFQLIFTFPIEFSKFTKVLKEIGSLTWQSWVLNFCYNHIKRNDNSNDNLQIIGKHLTLETFYFEIIVEDNVENNNL